MIIYENVLQKATTNKKKKENLFFQSFIDVNRNFNYCTKIMIH